MLATIRRGVLALAAVALLATPLYVASAGPGGPDGDGPRAHRRAGMQRIARQLNLTEDQRHQMKDIRARHWTAGLGDAVKAARDAQRDVRRLVADPSATDAQIAAAVTASTNAVTRAAVARHAMLRDMQSILTPEQQEKLRVLRENRAQGPRPARPRG